MWSDNEAENDFLNFTGVAATVAEIIDQAHGRPISVGISGAWGVGKSSMIKLIRHALEPRDETTPTKYVFLEFNAWLYQGYDDARAALIEEIARTLEQEAESRKSGVDKAKAFVKRVDWFRAGKLTVGTALSIALGVPPIGQLGEVIELGKKLVSGKPDENTATQFTGALSKLESSAAGLLRPKSDSTPPQAIQDVRQMFQETLEAIGVKLVVLIDDLDRCLPETTISTLEAIRLFLFIKNTAFVIAADEEMIKYAVRRHFEGVDDAVATNYFDKLIQVPIRVPALGTQEVRAYLMLLYVDASEELSAEAKETVRVAVCKALGKTWRGERVDRAFMQTLSVQMPTSLIARLDSAERLAPIMTTATKISGNPRLIKRFLNSLSIRTAMARSQEVTVDEAVLAKMLLFERCGPPGADLDLRKRVSESPDGKPAFLASWEEKAFAGEDFKLDRPWDDAFVREWLTIPPRLGDLDLRGALYLSREHAPLITPEDRMTSEAIALSTALLGNPEVANSLKERVANLTKPELALIMDKLLERANRVQEWGVPQILDACIVLAEVDPAQAQRLSAFLRERPHSQIRASIVPRIYDFPWAAEILASWQNGTVAVAVKRAITQRTNGNIAK
jgi:predicted KAP-like P-loop ATPase